MPAANVHNNTGKNVLYWHNNELRTNRAVLNEAQP